MTIDEAAKVLRKHPESVRRLCRTGGLEYGKAGRRFVFTAKQLEDYVQSRGSAGIAAAVAKKLKA